MDKKSDNDALAQMIGEFSVPYENLEEVKTVSIKLDALVSVLLKAPFAERRVGLKRLQELSSGAGEAPAVLREIGGERFERTAQLADALLKITRASVLDNYGTEEILEESNAIRDAFAESCQKILSSILD